MRLTLADSAERRPLSENYWLWACLAWFFGLWTYTFIWTPDYANWFLENLLVFALLAFIAVTYRRYQFSDLSYLLITAFLSLHVYGSMYTYAENPFGFWLMDTLELQRNHYDRIVHFSFGLLLAYPLLEMFLEWVRFPRWIGWALPTEITLSISGMYELIEWAVADLFFTAQGPAYLGTQGDVWDAQKDMFLAVLGAVIATLILYSTIVRQSSQEQRSPS